LALRDLRRGETAPSAFDEARVRWQAARDAVRELRERLADARAALTLANYEATPGERFALRPLRARAVQFLAERDLSERHIRRAIEDLEDALAAAMERLRAAQVDYEAERDREGDALARRLQPRHRAAVMKLAKAIEALSAATAEERAVRAELLASGLAPTGHPLLPDASSVLLGSLDEFESPASRWARDMRRQGVLD